MSLRFYICPIIGDGKTEATAFRSKIDTLASTSQMIPHNPDGTPMFNWCLLIARSTDWSTLDGDPTLERLFGVDLPDTVDTFADLKVFLQSKTVADIPAARRTALNTRLTNHGIDTSQVALATTWWQLLRGIYKMLNYGNAIAGDGPQV